jgi:hypothetical protein
MTTEKIFIGIDDQVIEAKGEVLTNLVSEIEAMKEKETAAQTAAIQKAEAKSALLARLGMTAEEAALLLS